MVQIIINQKNVKKNKLLKGNQKLARKLYGKDIKPKLKAKIDKIMNLNSSFIDLTNDNGKIDGEGVKSYEEIILAIKNSNFVGLGGEANDITVKLEAINAYKGDKYLLINAVECDPGVVHDHYLTKNKIDNIIKATKELNSIFKFKKCVIASKEELNINDELISYKACNRYPMGYEKIIIKEALGIDAIGYPTDSGVLTLNVQTVALLYEVMHKRSFDSKYITLANLITGKSVVIRAPFNMKVIEIAKLICDYTDKTIYVGGGALFAHEANLNEVIDATTGLVAIGNSFSYLNNSCKGCGKCIHVCPSHLNLKKIVKLHQKGIKIDRKLFNTEACISCGACSYFCAANKDIRGLIATINTN